MAALISPRSMQMDGRVHPWNFNPSIAQPISYSHLAPYGHNQCIPAGDNNLPPRKQRKFKRSGQAIFRAQPQQSNFQRKHGIDMQAHGSWRRNDSKPRRFWKKQKLDIQGRNTEGVRLEDGEFRPPRLHDLKKTNRAKTRKFFPKERPGSVPHAPRNTTSFIMRSSKMGLDANTVESTPEALQAPFVSPTPWNMESGGDKQFGEEAKELHVNPYGSMNGCIRLKTPDISDSEGNDGEVEKAPSSGEADSEATSTSGSGEVGTSGIQLLDERMDHGLHRFEMLYNTDQQSVPVAKSGDSFLRARVEEQEKQMGHLEEENLLLRERLYVAEQELKELRRRLGDGSDGLLEMEGDNSEDEASCAANMA